MVYNRQNQCFSTPLTKISILLLTFSIAVIFSPTAALIRESVISTASIVPTSFDSYSMESPSQTLRPDQRIVSAAVQSDTGVGTVGSDEATLVEDSISDIWSFNSRLTQCKDIEVSLSTGEGVIRVLLCSERLPVLTINDEHARPCVR